MRKVLYALFLALTCSVNACAQAIQTRLITPVEILPTADHTAGGVLFVMAPNNTDHGTISHSAAAGMLINSAVNANQLYALQPSVGGGELQLDDGSGAGGWDGVGLRIDLSGSSNKARMQETLIGPPLLTQAGGYIRELSGQSLHQFCTAGTCDTRVNITSVDNGTSTGNGQIITYLAGGTTAINTLNGGGYNIDMVDGGQISLDGVRFIWKTNVNTGFLNTAPNFTATFNYSGAGSTVIAGADVNSVIGTDSLGLTATSTFYDTTNTNSVVAKFVGNGGLNSAPCGSVFISPAGCGAVYIKSLVGPGLTVVSAQSGGINSVASANGAAFITGSVVGGTALAAWYVSNIDASGTCFAGSFWSHVGGTSGHSLWACGGTAWVNIA